MWMIEIKRCCMTNEQAFLFSLLNMVLQRWNLINPWKSKRKPASFFFASLHGSASALWLHTLYVFALTEPQRGWVESAFVATASLSAAPLPVPAARRPAVATFRAPSLIQSLHETAGGRHREWQWRERQHEPTPSIALPAAMEHHHATATTIWLKPAIVVQEKTNKKTLSILLGRLDEVERRELSDERIPSENRMCWAIKRWAVGAVCRNATLWFADKHLFLCVKTSTSWICQFGGELKEVPSPFCGR